MSDIWAFFSIALIGAAGIQFGILLAKLVWEIGRSVIRRARERKGREQ